MEFNREKVLQLYAGGKEELRAQRSRSNSIEFYYTEKILRECLPKNAHILELGCGTGYYGMLFADLCASYTGIDLSPDNIAEFRRKIDSTQKTNLRAEVGNATALTGIPDNAFDAVLCLGPMYHLPPAERQKVFQECYRVGREHACFAFAYINRIGVYAGACVNDHWRDIYPNETTNRYIFSLDTDDEKPGLFFFTSPEEMEADAKQHGFSVLANRGLDFSFASCAIDGMRDEQFSCYLDLADRMSSSPSCTGLANHALLLCKKNNTL